MRVYFSNVLHSVSVSSLFALVFKMATMHSLGHGGGPAPPAYISPPAMSSPDGQTRVQTAPNPNPSINTVVNVPTLTRVDIEGMNEALAQNDSL